MLPKNESGSHKFNTNILKRKIEIKPLNHLCMPSPLAPDQSGFIHVFVVYSEPIEIVWR